MNQTDSTGEAGDEIVVTGCRSCHQAPSISFGSLPFSAPSMNNVVRNLTAVRNFVGSILMNEKADSDVDVTDPDSVEGKTPEEVEKAAKEKGWTEKDAKTGADKGRRYTDASGNNGIRVMTGGGNRTGADSAVKSGGPYAQIVGGRNAGKVIPLAGNRTLGK